MAFAERPVPRELARYVRRIRWVSELAGPTPYRRYPDGETELVVRFGAGPTEANVIGTRTELLLKPAAQHANFVLLRFRVGEAHAFFGAPMSELADRVVPAAELWGAYACARLREADDFASVERASLDALGRMLQRGTEHASARKVRQAVRAVQLQERIPNAAELARTLGVSERHLRRAFTEVVGMPPKRYLRVARFQRALALARASSQPDWSALAQHAGYFDQAHLISEFRALAGATPGRLGR